MSKILKVGKALTPFEDIGEVAIGIENDKIKKIVPWGEISREEKVFDYSDAIASPGFIDIHTHGYGGNETTSGEEEDLANFSEAVPKHGVTSFLPSTVTASQENLLKVCSSLEDVVERDRKGARILGLHLEGPHVGSGDEAGAQNVEFARSPDSGELGELFEASGGRIERITLAPELPGSLEYIGRAGELGITVAAGHTAATYEEAIKGFNAGISICNHLYNGMKGFHHRNPGIIGACLIRDDVYVEMIVDMHHLHPAAIEMALKAKGVERSILITDSISATGLPDGEYELGGLETIVEDGVCRLEDSGRLAGSTLTMDVAVENMVSKLSVDLTDAVRMATINPANVLGLQKYGRLAPGSIADITIFDSEFNIMATMIDGEFVYESS
ncbi:hypothetical protein AKJ63_01240 [candidate division MSBL1 archaeon SCGC-AAA259D18]|uniref:Amidohydrolase-related domain-containing protein n=1 Tax=candidate division MSBL1 archaeon SCGC-AAA259D18 TaxID=1698262 RepID=A0A133UBR0_9EURY|nr:hypothetical protein AKJ63_01240 [candidate division MSBL1 archaeon SCGC-AAA259D18]